MDDETTPPTTAKRKPAVKPRNIIVCCDGTSNEPRPAKADAGATNVVHLFRCLQKTDDQIVFYDPGVGTSGILDLWRRRTDRVRALAQQATGYGLDQHVVNAYRFICEHYRPGDKISIFGFSRGAYTARVVAALIHHVGVLRPEQCNLAHFALKAYKESKEANDLSIGWRFKRAVGTRFATIHFLGLWDTVGSMIAPLKDRIGFGLTTLPSTNSNPSVEHVRHAMAIDERRAMFRLSHWEPEPFVPNPFEQEPKSFPQDVEEVWFAGAHGDIGGGHPEAESGLPKVSLLWMIGEATAAGLKFNRTMVARVTTVQYIHDKLRYCAASALGPDHPQPTGAIWRAMEYIPKQAKYREQLDRKALFGWYIPGAEPRPIKAGEKIHASVLERIADGKPPPFLPGQAADYKVAATKPY